VYRLSKEKELLELKKLFLLSLALTAPVFMIMMVFMHIPELKKIMMFDCVTTYNGPGVKLPLSWMISGVLTTPVQFGIGARFYKGAYR
jgi:P-type Cu+ transporter